MEIRIKGLTRDYYSEGKRIRALDNVDLTIPANRIFTLLGPSGCGKTTLLRCIVGLEVPDSGEIAIGDEVVWSKEKGHLRAAGEAGARDGLPDLRHLAPHERLRQRGLPAEVPQHADGGDPVPGGQVPQVRAARRVREPPGDEAQRRAAAAGGAGPGAGRRAEGHPVRRTLEQPGREAPGRDPQGASHLPLRASDHRGLRDARPDRGAGPFGPDRGHARRPHRRGRRPEEDLFPVRHRNSWPISSAAPT